MALLKLDSRGLLTCKILAQCLHGDLNFAILCGEIISVFHEISIKLSFISIYVFSFVEYSFYPKLDFPLWILYLHIFLIKYSAEQYKLLQGYPSSDS